MTKFKEEDGTSLDKTAVLQQARQKFMKNNAKTTELVDSLTKCIFVLFQERLAPTEATDLFFHITRLFQYKDKDSTLRRLIYIGIKALSQQAENVYVVTSSLTNDVNSSDDPTVRASALRALCQISDASTFTSIERYLRQGVVDRHPVVASAAISSLIRVARDNGEIVRRCTSETQEALNSDSPMVQYHALGLRYTSCKNERLAVSRLISNCIQQGLKSPLATCLLIRIISNSIEYNNVYEARDYYKYIKNNIENRSDMVEYEAAEAILSIKSDPKDRKTAIDRLKRLLASSKPALRFAAARCLNRVAMHSPEEVRECQLDLETLISQSDCNRSIAILAITTLLQIATENTFEKFLKQIAGFLSEIDDDFKVIVVTSVRQLCQKYPAKHAAMLDFLSNMLREEGGYLYKKAIVETIIKIIEDNEDTKEKGLEQLCEFIEDCEHVSLAVEVLNLIGREGPKTKRASTYIRFIANRLLLDASPVACAATSALAKFGVVPGLGETIETALERFSLNEDYEVMERVVFYKNLLNAQKMSLASNSFKISYSDLESKLSAYLDGDCQEPFNMSCVAAPDAKVTPPVGNEGDVEAKVEENPQPRFPPPSEILDDVELGDLIKSTSPTSLTERELEFGVQYIKHTYKDYVVFQFNCTNTVEQMQLENVGIDMTVPDGFETVVSTECPVLSFGDTKAILVCVEMVSKEAPYMVSEFTDIVLKYNYRTVDPETKEVDDDEPGEDTFPLFNLTVELPDFMAPLRKNFNHVWEQELSPEDEIDNSLTMNQGDLNSVTQNIINIMGMEVHNNSDQCPPRKKSHVICLGSVFHGKSDILLRVMLELSDRIVIKLKARSQDQKLSQSIMEMFN